MGFVELFLVAAGLSMDAFAVAVCSGLAMDRATVKKALIVGAYFGFFQAAMPLAGYLLAARFAGGIARYAHWVAFVLLGLIGGRMIAGGLRKEGCPDRQCPDGACADRACPGGKRPGATEASLSPRAMLPLALATSVDALAVGVSFAFLGTQILPAILTIGSTTLLLSTAGVKIGSLFGGRFKARAELAGGVILVLIGAKILLERMGGM